MEDKLKIAEPKEPKNDLENTNQERKVEELDANLVQAKKKMRFWLLVSALCLLAAFILAFAVYFAVASGKKAVRERLNEDNSFTLNESKLDLDFENDFVLRRLDGIKVAPGEDDLMPLAVIIDNHPDARPAFGIEKAQLVIEAEAEGGITRFLAFFSGSEQIEIIGPVRSARPYFIDWAKEVSAFFVHVGGSPEALAKISKERTPHINEFYNGAYFWRGKDYFAPHNVFTSSDKLRGYLELKEIKHSNFIAWNFGDEKKDLPLDSENKNAEIKIDFLLSGFVVSWVYEPDLNSYLRRVGGKPQLSGSGENIFAKNVVIQYIKSEVIDAEKRQKFSHIGEGKALVCLDGFCSEGTWKKRDSNFRTKFYDTNGDEFVFNPGTTWIEAVNPNYSVKY